MSSATLHAEGVLRKAGIQTQVRMKPGSWSETILVQKKDYRKAVRLMERISIGYVRPSRKVRRNSTATVVAMEPKGSIYTLQTFRGPGASFGAKAHVRQIRRRAAHGGDYFTGWKAGYAMLKNRKARRNVMEVTETPGEKYPWGQGSPVRKAKVRGVLTYVGPDVFTIDNDKFRMVDPRYWSAGSSQRASRALYSLTKLVGKRVVADADYHQAFGWTVFGRRAIKLDPSATNPLTKKESASLARSAHFWGKAGIKAKREGLSPQYHAGRSDGLSEAIARYGPRKARRVVRKLQKRAAKVWLPNPNLSTSRHAAATWKAGEAAHKFLSHMDGHNLSLFRDVSMWDFMMGNQKATTARKSCSGTVLDRYNQFIIVVNKLWPMIQKKDISKIPLRIAAGSWGTMEQMRSDF